MNDIFRGKPIIALMPLYDDERDSYWMLPGYMKSLEEQGAIPVMPPLSVQRDELDYFLEVCDGFVLTGGHDVTPKLYRAHPSPYCGQTSPLRDNMDQYILTHAVKQGKPILGICRGIQLMNVVYGGTLYQDLPSEHPSNIEHHMAPPYNRPAHKVEIIPHTPLAQLLQTPACEVNSYHHQAIKTLAQPFSTMAIAPDGTIEGIYMPNQNFVWGIQWHPEFSYQNDETSRKILGAFLQASLGDKGISLF